MALRSNELLGISGNYDLSYDLKPSIISDAYSLDTTPPSIVNPGKIAGSLGRIGTAAAAGSVIPGVGTAVGAVAGTLLELGFQIFDYNERKREADRVAQLEKEARLKTSETEARNVRMLEEDLSLRKQSMREARRERQKEWAWREEDQQWQRNREAVGYFMDTISQKPQLEEMLLSRWRKAA